MQCHLALLHWDMPVMEVFRTLILVQFRCYNDVIVKYAFSCCSCLDELRQHICSSSVAAGPVQVAFAVWHGRSLETNGQAQRLLSLADRSDCMASISQDASRAWPRYRDSVAFHNRVISVSNRSVDELAQYIENAVINIKHVSLLLLLLLLLLLSFLIFLFF